MRYPTDIGADLVAARRQAGVTQTELGRRLGVSQPQIARWESNRYRTASLDRVDAVARALGAALDGPMLAAEENRAPYGSDPNTELFRRIGTDAESLAEVCTRHAIVELGLFGSALRDDFRLDSDIDVLVRFDPDAGVSLMDLLAAKRDLEALFGRDVDLAERQGVEGSENYIKRRSILGSLRNLYAA